MTTGPEGGPPPGKGGKPGKPGKGGWLAKNKNMAIIGAAAGGALLLVMLKKGSGSAAAGTGTTVQPSLYGTSGVTGSTGYDPAVASMYQYQQQMDQLQGFLNAWSAGTAFPKPAAGATGPAGPAGPPGPPSSNPAKPPAPPAPASRWQWITVKPGQTLSSLSQQYLGTSNRTAIAHANNLGTGAGLRTGQRLYV